MATYEAETAPTAEIRVSLNVITHGSAGPLVIVIHGGPAAAGSARGVALGLADMFSVLEPWQRGSGPQPLTVARHVEDLHELVAACGHRARPALVGESWGAMLALAYGAAHPERVGPIVLVGCGTFDPPSRACLRETLAARQTDNLCHRLAQLADEITDPGELLCKQHELSESIYTFEPISITGDATQPVPPPFDLQAHTETWQDMLRLQEEGVYPSSFAAIKTPVLMLHGTYDPHPGRMIHDSLKPYLPQLEYHEFDRCGHSPWIEKHARESFFLVLHQWLMQTIDLLA